MLLGRKTYEIWKAFWPQHKDGFIGAAFDRATKYVALTTLAESDWQKTVILKDNMVDEIKKLKQSDGPELQVHGSDNFIQTLLNNELVDELWLKIFPKKKSRTSALSPHYISYVGKTAYLSPVT